MNTWLRIAGSIGALAIAFGGVYLYRAFLGGSRGSGQSSRGVASLYLPGALCQNLHHAVCKRKTLIHDPTGTVRSDIDDEKEALSIYEAIIHEHPSWGSDDVDDELVYKLYTPEKRKKLDDVFHWVRDAIERLIDNQPSSVFTDQEKSQLVQRLRKTELELPPPASIYADERELFTKTDVFYERAIADAHQRLRVGGAYAYNLRSFYNLVFTFGHELAHSIDPCEIRSARLSFPAYDRVIACFLKNNVIATRKTRSECGKNDQLSESFADWVGTQVTAEALNTFGADFTLEQKLNALMNSVRDLCEEESEEGGLDFELHPRPETRINQIFAVNPAIRTILGCPTATGAPGYCGFE